MSARWENRRRAAEGRLRRALEGYLDGVVTAEELESVRIQYKIESEQTVERGKSGKVSMPDITRELWEDILWETGAQVTVFPGSLSIRFCGQRKELRIWYSTEGKGKHYKTVFQRWETLEK